MSDLVMGWKNAMDRCAGTKYIQNIKKETIVKEIAF